MIKNDKVRIFEYKTTDLDGITKSYEEIYESMELSLKDVIEENQNDMDRYGFSVKRVRNFLSFEIYRGNEFSAFSVMLKSGSKISLNKGHAAGIEKNYLSCYELISWKEKESYYRWGFSRYTPIRTISGEKRNKRNSNNSFCAVSTKDFPWFAVDDTVTVDNEILNIPQGLGVSVYNKILEVL